jgi:hypothetical protein
LTRFQNWRLEKRGPILKDGAKFWKVSEAKESKYGRAEYPHNI